MKKPGELPTYMNVRLRAEKHKRVVAWFLYACKEQQRPRVEVLVELMEAYNRQHGYVENGKEA